MKCPACARDIGPGSSSCMYCGEEIPATYRPEKAPFKSPKRRTRGHIKRGTTVGQLVSGVVVCVVAFIVILFLMGICGPD